MYLDGQTVNPQVRGTSSNSTLFANFEPPLDSRAAHGGRLRAGRARGVGDRLGLHGHAEVTTTGGGLRSP